MAHRALACFTIFALLLIGACAHTKSAGRVVDIRVSVHSDGLRLHYLLPNAVTSFSFGGDEHLPESARLQLLTGGLKLTDRTVTSATPFTSFAVSIAPDANRLDATYPALVRIGEAHLLYFPLFKPDPAHGSMRLHFDLPDDWAVENGGGSNGFVFVGPATYVSRGDSFTVVASPGMPAWLTTAVTVNGAAALDYYRAQLGVRNTVRPVLVVSYDDKQTAAGFVGDVTPNGVVLLQVTPAVDRLPGGGEAVVSRFLAHEFFHVWNSRPYRDLPDLNGHWLREGAAEYVSWLAATELWPSGDRLEERLTAQLAPCMATLGDDALIELKDQRAQTTRYSCGSIASWLTDVALRSSGHGHFFTLWSAILKEGSGYDARSFETHVARTAGAAAGPLQTLLRSRGSERWPGIFDALRGAGVIVEQVPPGDAALRSAAVQTLLREACSGETFGFETHGLTEPPDKIVLRTEPMAPHAPSPDCGSLGGDPELLAIDGRSVVSGWKETLERISAACERGRVVGLIIRRGQRTEGLGIACSAPALVPPAQYEVRRALPT